MARNLLICDTDTGTLSFDAGERPRCRDGSNNSAWVVVDENSLEVETITDLSIADGLEITAAIALVWTVGFIGRTVIRTVLKTRSY